MAREFRLPDIGEGLTEAEVVRWLVPVGGTVMADQAIVEVETDKAVVEIPSPYAGVVLRHGGGEGETIKVGEVLVVIGEPGEATGDEDVRMAPEVEEAEEAPVVTTAAPVATTAAPIVGTISEEAETLGSSRSEMGGQVKALPIVRKLARDHGVDLADITGTGPGGRITRQDVEAQVANRQTLPAAAAAADAEPVTEPVTVTTAETTEPSDVGTRRPMSRLRRTIAANMSRSWAEIPHVTTFDDVDATRLLEVRDALTTRHGVKVPIEALVIKAVVPALVAHPEFNATVDGDDLVLHSTHDIGIAVDTPEGLMVAVVRDAGSKGVLALAEEVRRLGEGARARSLGVEELTGQTFTVSNIGAVGGGHGTPIVPPGTTAILSVGRARNRPIAYGDEIGIAPVMPLSLSYDHRVIDGAMGRRFMSLVLENLEEPALFLAV
ncbi:MAG: 2-oxo acid dehydrogenase subunit E2 [Actinobacteria bacterium]|nr:2-oxo acid dehydrogenase subunit E2 [Actinomycetota bacterium]